ncbi:cell division protein ZapE [Luteimonas pelagia]
MADAAGAPAPGARYDAGIARGDWQADPAQRPALAELDRIHHALLADDGRRGGGLLSKLFGSNDAAKEIPGLYLWGGVGRGKTFLVDLFHDGLPLPEVSPVGEAGERGKHRTHFHRFMREVHARLRARSGERDPLAAVAADWGRRLRVLVLDEFFVSDIGDAMLLARLLEGLFAQGTVLVTSSNTPPRNLYKDGLQRVRFLPAIDLIQAHCHVLELDSDTDYRLRALTRSAVYRAPLDADSGDWLRTRWNELAAGAPREDGPLVIDGRAIPAQALAEGHAWFDFDALCEGPRATGDYIEIAREFHTVVVGGIPRFDGTNDDPARRFVHLVDEFYDRHVNLVCTADAAPQDLYAGERLAHAFERTASRLIEMQSAEYLALEHRG